MKIIIACGAVIVAIILATFWMQVQTGEMLARQAVEIRLLKQDVLTHRARINELAAEQDWVRNSVRIQMEVMK